MSPAARKTLPPRILVLIGVAAFVISNFVAGQPTLQAGLRLGGGLVALAGLAWFLMALRAARR